MHMGEGGNGRGGEGGIKWKERNKGEGRQLGLRVIWETVGFKGTFGKAEIGRDVEKTVIQVNIEMRKKLNSS